MLGKLELPKFNGDLDDYNRFIVSFEAIISKYQLSPFEKYSYLIKQLSGNARALIETIPASDLTYDTAKRLLDEAFCNKLTQQYAVIEKLASLKLKSNEDPYKWICSARVLADQVNTLQISSELFTQYFLWGSLSEDLKAIFVSITNSSKPDLDELLNNAFEASNRFKEFLVKTKIQKSEKPKNYLVDEQAKPQTIALASNVKSFSPINQPERRFQNSRNCSLCSYDKSPAANTHSLSHCKKYESTQSKLDKIRLTNGCVLCGHTNHCSDNCFFHFSIITR